MLCLCCRLCTFSDSTCFRCNRRNQSPESCFHKDSESHTCKRKGHISLQCPKKKFSKFPAKDKSSSRKLSKARKRKKDSRIRLVGTESGSESEGSSSSHDENSGNEWPMFSVRNSSKGKSDEILIPLIMSIMFALN